MCGQPTSVVCTSHKALLDPMQVVAKAADIQKSIDEGATAFLATEYYYLSIFIVSCFLGGGLLESGGQTLLTPPSHTLAGPLVTVMYATCLFAGDFLSDHLLPAEHCHPRGRPHPC